MMPTETPAGTLVFTAPKYCAKEVLAARSCASKTAVSNAALAMRCPLAQCRLGATASAVNLSPSFMSSGMKNSDNTAPAPVWYSLE
ncbi:unannotated protein [freshwater metagenome]|uniref:Unannotated protein n=1 Tax=freshwater metagenome TaxID=449393 RepID=A0A6J7C782_9ZZZZ